MTTPDLSVVLVTDHFTTIRRVVRHLGDQTARAVIEIVIVCPSAVALEADSEALGVFAGVVVKEVRSVHPMSLARAVGVRAATADVVFLGETHSYPHPEFAATVIATHRDAWDVVVPGMDNANDDGAMSWAAFLIDYGYWLFHLPAGQVGAAPTWNVAYKRKSLMDLGTQLGTALTGGDELATAFRERGHTIYFQPAARLDHANVSRSAGDWLHERYLSGLLVGGNRRGRWGASRRWLYVLASPLIPVVLIYRTAPSVRAALRRGRLPRFTIPALVVGAMVRTLGEVVGYIAGARAKEEERMEEYELHKVKYTAAAP